MKLRTTVFISLLLIALCLSCVNVSASTSFIQANKLVCSDSDMNMWSSVKQSNDGILYYYINGDICVGKPGLVEYNGAYYDVKWSGKVAVNENRNITAEKIGNLNVEPDTYYFDTEGKMQIPFTGVKEANDGILYYYINGKICTGKSGLIEYNGSYYDVKWSGKVAVNENRNITAEKIGSLDVEPDTYYFDAEGKMQVPFTGVKKADDGVLYYYVNGKICTGKSGLIEYKGAYYDVKLSGKVAVNESRNITIEKTNGFAVTPGKYFFDEEGKIICPKKMLTIIDDDGYGKFFDLLLPIVKEKQVSITSAVPTGYINGEVPAVADRVMSWEEIQECYDSGAEILSHTHMHITSAKVEKMTYNEILNDYMESYKVLGHHNIVSPGVVFAGGSVTNTNCQNAAKEVFQYGFKSAGDKINRYGEFDPYKINRYGIYSDDYDDLKNIVDELKNEGTGWMVWMIHTSDSEFQQQEADCLSEAIDYALSNGIEIVSSYDGYKMYSSNN